MITKGLTAVAAAAVLALAGCGGGDGGDSNKALSYSAFGEEADKVCADADAKIDPVTEKLTGQADNDAPLYDELIPAFEDASKKFKDLKPPDELKPDFDTFNATTDQQIAVAKEAQTAAKSGDQAAYEQAIGELEPLDKQSDEAASRLGAAKCAED